MIHTKLILIDGISGSGKSTMAHFLARQMEKNGINVRWYHEEETGHPLRHSGDFKSQDEEIRAKDYFVLHNAAHWQKFADANVNNDTVFIIECYLFQYPLVTMIRNNTSREEVKAFARNYFSKVASLNPVIIQFWQNDVPAAVQQNWSRRGEEWKEWHIGRCEKTAFAKKHNLVGEFAAYGLLGEMHDISLELAKEYDVPKLLIENSAQDWATYRKNALDFLQIDHYPEEVFRESDRRFCGDYYLKIEEYELTYTVFVADGRLRMNAFWPNLTLLPKTDNEFLMESFPFEFRFNHDGNGNIDSMEVTKSRMFFEVGMKFEKIL